MQGSVTVILPMTFDLSLVGGLTEEMIRDEPDLAKQMIKDFAAYLFETSPSESVIQDCSESTLIE